ncbi:protein of unknown function DUF1486 [Candidatus Paraburkholderia kirkii UZHbot1]|uniref:HTH tetR-type domain-containing protein n=1 Tax=Candidatus Paraburkholderia kirkii UZHbot1 TaxID=1055526 RepID=G4MFV0_9BURK|nr:protein of unknown function DUF1486 [Candidatus Paraburkholderia kirkii UZHbot1]
MEMDRKIEEHFGFERRDDVDGVLATLTEDVEHDVVGWPAGPARGRPAARPFYEALFADLSESRVECLRRLYGDGFLIDESLWSGKARAGLSGSKDAGALWNSACCMSSNSAQAGRFGARTCGSILRRSSDSCRRTDMPGSGTKTRENQKRRMRKDLLQAASRLMKQGRKPDLEEIATEAAVSRATAYRHFPSIDALLLEASLDVATPDAGELFSTRASADPVTQLLRVDAALHDMILANEALLRMMLAHSLQRVARGESEGDVPLRQNRRTPLIEAALEPARAEFTPAALETLVHALALVIGTEAMVVCKDVLQLDDARVCKIKRSAIRALVDAARRSG